MGFADKLKTVRKSAGLSQEALADKLNVSRQSVTKWESGAGMPDIENLTALSVLFGISLDEFLSDVKIISNKAAIYESVTEYDVDRPKRFDINLGTVKDVKISCYGGEKLRIKLASDVLKDVQSDVKIKIDDGKSCLDADILRLNGIPAQIIAESLSVLIELPRKYTLKTELSVNAESVEVRSVENGMELGGKMRKITLDGVVGTVEIDCNIDTEITCLSLGGAVEINQISAISRIRVPFNAEFKAIKRGIGNNILYEIDGKPADPFGVENCENVIELNGMKSELIICKAEK